MDRLIKFNPKHSNPESIKSMSLRYPNKIFSTRIKHIWRGTLVGILIGIVSGLGGMVFNFLLNTSTSFFTEDLISLILPDSLVGQQFLGFPIGRWMMLWIPALGGLISGIIVFSLAPEAEGHGTDAMIESFHGKKALSEGVCL
jgi:chloride channel protein, CIC family